MASVERRCGFINPRWPTCSFCRCGRSGQDVRGGICSSAALLVWNVCSQHRKKNNTFIYYLITDSVCVNPLTWPLFVHKLSVEKSLWKSELLIQKFQCVLHQVFTFFYHPHPLLFSLLCPSLYLFFFLSQSSYFVSLTNFSISAPGLLLLLSPCFCFHLTSVQILSLVL